MKHWLIGLAILLTGVASHGQIASPTQFGLIKVGTGLAVDAGGTLNMTQSSVYTNTAITQTAVQTAITNAAANSRVLLTPGIYTLTSNLLIQNKDGLTLDGGGQVTFTGSINTFLLYSGLINKLRVTGIRFISTLNTTSELDGMITTDQTIRGSGYELDHCYFKNSKGNFNQHSWVPVDGRAGQATNTNKFTNVYIHHNTFDSTGRCNVELLNQNLDYERVENLNITDNTMFAAGLINQYGMGVSLSGRMRNVKIHQNKIQQSKYYAIEAINCSAVNILGNTIESTIAGCAGISANDQADPNSLTIANEHYTITGNTVRVPYSPIQTTGINYLTITGNELYNLNSTDISNGGVRIVNGNYGTFTGNVVLSSSYNALTLNGTKRFTVQGNYLSNRLMTSGGTSYQVLWLYGSGTTGNLVGNNIYDKNTAQSDAQNFVYESDGATNNLWSDSRAGLGTVATDGTRRWIKISGSTISASTTP